MFPINQSRVQGTKYNYPYNISITLLSFHFLSPFNIKQFYKKQKQKAFDSYIFILIGTFDTGKNALKS